MAVIKVKKRQCDATGNHYDDGAPGSAVLKVQIAGRPDADGKPTVREYRTIDLSPEAVASLPTGKSRVPKTEDQIAANKALSEAKTDAEKKSAKASVKAADDAAAADLAAQVAESNPAPAEDAAPE